MEAIIVKVVIKEIGKSYLEGNNSIQVLDNISFVAEAGAFICLVGPSGCGKTTILNIIAGLVKNYEGEILFFDKEGKSRDNVTIGYVFQTSRLLNWRTLKGNVLFSIKSIHKAKARNRQSMASISKNYLDLVGLKDSINKYPLACSEGERIRTSIARALAIEPELIIMDEPFSHLDEITARKLRKEMLSICKGKRKTVIFVTHNSLEAVYLADKVIILSDKPTHIIGEIEIALPRPRSFEKTELLEYQKQILKKMGI